MWLKSKRRRAEPQGKRTRLGGVAGDQLEYWTADDLGSIEWLLRGVIGDHQGKHRHLPNALHSLEDAAACKRSQIDAAW